VAEALHGWLARAGVLFAPVRHGFVRAAFDYASTALPDPVCPYPAPHGDRATTHAPRPLPVPYKSGASIRCACLDATESVDK